MTKYNLLSSVTSELSIVLGPLEFLRRARYTFGYCGAILTGEYYLDSFQLLPSEFILDVAGVQSRCRFKEQDFAFLFRKGPVFDAAGHDDELTGLDPLGAIISVFAKVHSEAALHHQKHFVFILVVMPGEWAFELHQFEILIVQLADNSRVPVIINDRKLLREIDLVHCQWSVVSG